MGAIVVGTCKKCGYEIKFLQGGGMMNFQKIDMEPAYCSTCRSLTIENYKEIQVKCQKCGKPVVFYNDPSLSKSYTPDLKYPAIQWNQFCLPKKDCLCPKCGKMELEFKSNGNWD
jgi:predicted RNA-binding Zn-ribbon protein involved in translation (DUF1610 family)